jgi:hypothetical protein
MNIAGLEQIRQDFNLSASEFAGVLAAAAGHCVDKPLREIELHEVAYIYSACAAAIEEDASATTKCYSLQSQLAEAADRIKQLEAALIYTDDALQMEGGQPPNDPVEVHLYEGNHKRTDVIVHRPKEPA